MAKTPEPRLTIEFIGEEHVVQPGETFGIGRESDLVVDENPYLHRTFLAVHFEHGMWWLSNVGTLLSATVSDATGAVQAWLAPGARLPIVFEEMTVLFSAGSTTYDLTLRTDSDYFNTSQPATLTRGQTTVQAVALTPSQRLLVISLAEPILTQATAGKGEIPASAEAAERLGWSMTTFNRKLDNVCEKLDKLGVSGLRGGKEKLATNRRARLVEYALATRMVSVEDVALLDAEAAKNRSE